MISFKIIYLRDELNSFELRTPLIPKDVKILVKNKFIVYVKSSNNRIYKDDEYLENGAIITHEHWSNMKFKNALIVGLKEVELKYLDSNHHLYFSHSFKNQWDSQKILETFSTTNSIIYDFEYFLKENKRILSFGFYAGIVGCVLGIFQYYHKKLYNKNIISLKCWKDENEMLNHIKDFNFKNLNVGIIGANGNCGNGVKYILNKLNIEYTIIPRDDKDKNIFANFDIFYNCILLNENFNDIFFDKNTNFFKQICIVDISCDNNKFNNPIQLYKENTSWDNPVFNYSNLVDIIAISNLPSLLPKDSSNYFSNKCKDLILDIPMDKNNYWKNVTNIFLEKIKKTK